MINPDEIPALEELCLYLAEQERHKLLESTPVIAARVSVMIHEYHKQADAADLLRRSARAALDALYVGDIQRARLILGLALAVK